MRYSITKKSCYYSLYTSETNLYLYIMRCLLLAFLLTSLSLRAQEEEVTKHSLSVEFISYEYIDQQMNQQSFLNSFAWRYFSEIAYRLNIGQPFYWHLSLSYADHSVDDNCIDCYDPLSGTGQLREFGLRSGFGAYLPLFDQKLFTPFLEMNGSFTKWHYVADLQRKINGFEFSLDRTGNSIGIGPAFGLEIKPLKHFGLRVFGSGEILREKDRQKGSSGISMAITTDFKAGAALTVYF